MSLTFALMILEFSDKIKIKNMPKKITVFCHKFYDCNLAHVTEWVLANQNEPRRCEENCIHHKIQII